MQHVTCDVAIDVCRLAYLFQVERCMRVLDGCILVLDAVAGVQVQHFPTSPSTCDAVVAVQVQTQQVYKQAMSHSLPLVCFVNKMDRSGASAQRAVASMQRQLPGCTPLLLQLPLYDASGFRGCIDLVHMRCMLWPAGAAPCSSSACACVTWP